MEPADWSLRAARFRWAELLRRIFEVDPLACPRCRGLMRIVAVITRSLAPRARARAYPAVTESPAATTMLTHPDRGQFPSPVVPGPALGDRSRARVSRRRRRSAL